MVFGLSKTRHQPVPQDEHGFHDAKGKHLSSMSEPISERELDGLNRDDQQLKRKIRVIKLVIRFVTLALALYTTYSQGATLYNFTHTKDLKRETPGANGSYDTRGPWAKQTYIWPTIVLLSTSALTVVVSFITVISYFWGVKAANKVNTRGGTPATAAEICAHLAVWIATAVAYRVGRTTSDLWGWSCSPKANEIQAIFPEVNFQFFCSTQTGSWYVSLAQAVLAIVIAIVWILAISRRKKTKHLKAARQSYMSQQSPRTEYPPYHSPKSNLDSPRSQGFPSPGYSNSQGFPSPQTPHFPPPPRSPNYLR